MAHPRLITVKELMQRYNISQRTAVRWRRELRKAGLLVGISPGARTVIGDWGQIDDAVYTGTVGGQSHAVAR
ncbi:MAG: hypothetical protein MJE77_39540 [Proteobacteria bacterium]|nr:hypothetical protein [Pseudomonadota bacterium]